MSTQGEAEKLVEDVIRLGHAAGRNNVRRAHCRLSRPDGLYLYRAGRGLAGRCIARGKGLGRGAARVLWAVLPGTGTGPGQDGNHLEASYLHSKRCAPTAASRRCAGDSTQTDAEKLDLEETQRQSCQKKQSERTRCLRAGRCLPAVWLADGAADRQARPVPGVLALPAVQGHTQHRGEKIGFDGLP